MKLKGLTQRQLADQIGTSQASISKWLRGAMPQADQLHAASTALGVTMEWLLTGESSTTGASAPASARPSKAIRKALDEARASLDRLEKHLDT